MKITLFLLCVVHLSGQCHAQSIEAINDDSTKRVLFTVNKLVECIVEINRQPVPVRGYIRLIDPTEFRVETAPGMYQIVQLQSVLSMRTVSRRYLKRLGAAGAPLIYSPINGGMHSSPTAVVAAAVLGAGIAAVGGTFDNTAGGPSGYQGWVFVVHPK